MPDCAKTAIYAVHDNQVNKLCFFIYDSHFRSQCVLWGHVIGVRGTFLSGKVANYSKVKYYYYINSFNISCMGECWEQHMHMPVSQAC